MTSVEGPTIHFYRSFCYGPDIEVFVLDTRRGYLGKHQGKWLRHALKNSQATWKIILSGTPLGMTINRENKFQALASPIDANAHISRMHSYHHDKGILEDELDYNGKPKSSLLSIFSYLQSKVLDDEKSSIEGDESITQSIPQVESSAVNNGSPVFSPKSAVGHNHGFDFDSSVEGFDTNASKSIEEQRIALEAARGRTHIQSGIVLLSGGLASPYVATYDMNNNNQAYLCEVNTGSCLASMDSAEAPIQTNIDASPEFLYTRDLDDNQSTSSKKLFWNTLTLQPDGSLLVKIFSKTLEEKDSEIKLEYSITLTTNLISYHGV